MKNRMSIIFMITDKCNCNCFFCSRKNLSLNHIEQDLDNYYHAFDVLSNAYPSSKLVLSGGEPTLSMNFLDILNFVTSRFEKIEIQTNGTFDKRVADILPPFLNKNVYLQFSLDGTCNMHDSIRGNGTFEKVIQNIKHFQKYSSHLSISTTVTPTNMCDVLELASYLNNLSFRRLTVSYVQPLNPLKDRMLSSITWNNFVDELLPLCYYRVDISKLYDFALWDNFLESHHSWNGVVNCGRGVNHIYVTSDFDVLPCTCTDYRVGNLLVDDIETIKFNLSIKQKVCINSASVCQTCKYLAICNGGCPGLSKKVFGVENMGDIRCPKVLKKAVSNGLASDDNLI